MIRYQFRKAKFPLLLESDTIVVGAQSDGELNSLIKKLTFKNKGVYQVIDASGEGWSYYPEHNVLTPLTINKRWTKKAIIEFYNSSIKVDKTKEEYNVGSLSNRKLTTIIEEIVILSSKP